MGGKGVHPCSPVRKQKQSQSFRSARPSLPKLLPGWSWTDSHMASAWSLDAVMGDAQSPLHEVCQETLPLNTPTWGTAGRWAARAVAMDSTGGATGARAWGSSPGTGRGQEGTAATLWRFNAHS